MTRKPHAPCGHDWQSPKINREFRILFPTVFVYCRCTECDASWGEQYEFDFSVTLGNMTHEQPDDSVSIASNCYRAIETIERYGRQGFIVSVAFGPCGKYGEQYSVTVMDPTTGKEFYKPFGASSFADIAMILDIEVPAMLAR